MIFFDNQKTLDYIADSVYYTRMLQIITQGFRDILFLLGALFLALASRYILHISAFTWSDFWSEYTTHIYVFIPILIISMLCCIIYGLYDSHVLYKRRKLVQHIYVSSVWSLLLGLIWFYLFPQQQGLEPKTILALYTIYAVFGLSVSRAKYIFERYSTKKNTDGFRLVSLGESQESKDLHDTLSSRKNSAYHVFEYFKVTWHAITF